MIGRRLLEEKRSKLLANVAWVTLVFYTLALLVLTLDQFFDWGIWPPKLDRMLKGYIAELGDPSVPAEKKQQAADAIVSWHEFSVPLLIDAIEKNKPGVREPATRCLQDIASKFFNVNITPYDSDPKKLRAWWSEMKDRLEGRAKSPA
jgi:hypothetical protein